MTRTYMDHNIYQTTGRARANGWRWEALTATRGWVFATSLAGIKSLIRDCISR